MCFASCQIGQCCFSDSCGVAVNLVASAEFEKQRVFCFMSVQLPRHSEQCVAALFFSIFL
jgi:hypothetical protein